MLRRYCILINQSLDPSSCEYFMRSRLRHKCDHPSSTSHICDVAQTPDPESRGNEKRFNPGYDSALETAGLSSG